MRASCSVATRAADIRGQRTDDHVNRSVTALAITALVLAFALVASLGFTAAVHGDRTLAGGGHRSTAAAHAALHPPIVFEPNVGQAPQRVDYVAHIPGGTAYLSASGVTLADPGGHQ